MSLFDVLSQPRIHHSRLLEKKRLQTQKPAAELPLGSPEHRRSGNSLLTSPTQEAVQQIAKYFGLSLSELRVAVSGKNRGREHLCLWSSKGPMPWRMLAFLREQEQLLARFPSTQTRQLSGLRAQYKNALLGKHTGLTRLFLSWELEVGSISFSGIPAADCERIRHLADRGIISPFSELAVAARKLGHNLFSERDSWCEEARQLWAETFDQIVKPQRWSWTQRRLWYYLSLAGLDTNLPTLAADLGIRLDPAQNIEEAIAATRKNRQLIIAELKSVMRRNRWTSLFEQLAGDEDLLIATSSQLRAPRMLPLHEELIDRLHALGMGSADILRGAKIFREKETDNLLQAIVRGNCEAPELPIGILCSLLGGPAEERQLWLSFLRRDQEQAIKKGAKTSLVSSAAKLWGLRAEDLEASWKDLAHGQRRSTERLRRILDENEPLADAEERTLLAALFFTGAQKGYVLGRSLDSDVTGHLLRNVNEDIQYWLTFSDDLLAEGRSSSKERSREGGRGAKGKSGLRVGKELTGERPTLRAKSGKRADRDQLEADAT